ncbi:MAG: NAD(P)/FAD-dependent oxidoreductase [candidate division WOR-3 bacterium]|nr:NAD(P)/FAD-dependent oxidoreductase [candidate division WOR-3 bacterium]
MKNSYDVVVIGGGPIGSYIAGRLAENGFTVCVFEQKERIGQGVVCTGVISKECFDRFSLPQKSILTKIKSFTFISPGGQRLEYITPAPFAYVVDRRVLDSLIAENSKKLGVYFKLGMNVTGIEEYNKYYKVIADGNECFTKFVIIATGVNYHLQRKLGLGGPPRFLYGFQIELPQAVAEDNIEIYISQRYAPGSFAWVVPVSKSLSRIGMILSRNGKEYLKKFVEQRLGFCKLDGKIIDTKPVAHGVLKKSVAGQILVVGEAAGQVKTTTGGGVFTGLLCADIAVHYLTKGLKYGNPIDEYEITWRSLLSAELEIGKKIRVIASKISDRTIEKLFSFVKYNRFWVDLVIPKINFDFHSDLLNFCLKSFSHLLKIT